MKTKLFLLVCYLSLMATTTIAQLVELEFRLYDGETKQPISNTHVFLVNTTYGTTSNEAGSVQLKIPQGIREDLLITHINYDTKILEYSKYNQLQLEDTLFLIPNQLDISEVVVTSKRSNKWKKRFKAFKRAFLGTDKVAAKCTILNPEVLRFKEIAGQLKVEAVDLIRIDNPYLGYEVHYLLSQLTIEADGSIEYLGKASFTDTSKGAMQKQILKNREKAYLQSPKHFFKSLIDNRLKEDGYKVQIAVLKNDQFETLKTPTREELLKKSSTGNYQLHFPAFLKVVNKNFKTVNYEKAGVRLGGLESRRFGSSQSTESAQFDYAISYLYKIAPFLVLNEFGNVLNTKKVKEYGYWATQRVAQQLPFDYGNDYEAVSKKITPIDLPVANQKPAIQLTNQQKQDLLSSLIYENDQRIKTQTLAMIESNWRKDFIPPLVEILRLSTDQWLIQKINRLLQTKTAETEIKDFYGWLQWLWKQEVIYEDYFSDFKGELYQHIDPKFKNYFNNQQESAKIRLDEIIWGGVKQDGIPPLRHPQMIAAKEATYLANKNFVFGLYINGEARAYPKRILAWHEFFVDAFDKVTIAGVYCTLCGTLIAYNASYKGIQHELGTSGFLYRSNKLMYDQATQSLWSTIQGKPVLGLLADKNIVLESYPVVTTTWGEWKTLHPDTKVLSLATGYDRDYGEGVAYSDYFATDDLMFPVPKTDNRLNNKEEVLIVRTPDYRKTPLAISIKYLRKKGWYQGKIGDTPIIIITEKTGAARAYRSDGIYFDSYKKGQLIDQQGRGWTVTEEYLQSSDNQRLGRLPAHTIFWFAWLNSYPNTRLIK